MKKRFCYLLAWTMLTFLLVGCGNQTTAQPAESPSDSAPLKVGMQLTFPPFATLNDTGKPAGIEVDIANALGEHLNRPVEIVETSFELFIPALETGQVDIIICDMSIKEERKEKVDFSDPYLYNPTLGLVNKDFAAKHHITDEMSEKDFFAINDTRFVGMTGTIAVSIPESFGHNVTSFAEIAPALKEIENGTADVLIGANTIIRDHASMPDKTLIYSGISEYSESAMAVKKGNAALLEQVNAFIKNMYQPGGFYRNAVENKTYDAAIGDYLQDDTKTLEYVIYPPGRQND